MERKDFLIVIGGMTPDCSEDNQGGFVAELCITNPYGSGPELCDPVDDLVIHAEEIGDDCEDPRQKAEDIAMEYIAKHGNEYIDAFIQKHSTISDHISVSFKHHCKSFEFVLNLKNRQSIWSGDKVIEVTMPSRYFGPIHCVFFWGAKSGNTYDDFPNCVNVYDGEKIYPVFDLKCEYIFGC